jgi:hypothetical protein
MRIDSWAHRHRIIAFTLAIGLQLALTVPFHWWRTTNVRGVPGPALVLVTTIAAFLVGARAGAVLGLIASIEAIAFYDINRWLTPPIWIGIAAISGYAGTRAFRDAQARDRLSNVLQQGLLPAAAAFEHHPRLRGAARYVAGEDRALLGGDFYGLVELEDHIATAMVGDVSGHDSTAAAIGAVLRASWRALVFAGADDLTIVGALDRTMREEQLRPGRSERFATVCTVRVDHEAGVIRIVLAGHHPPLLLTDGQIAPVPGTASPPLGVAWPGHREVVELPIPQDEWSLFLYTDGLIEGRAAPGSSERYGADRLVESIARRGRTILTDEDLGSVLDEIRVANGAALTDDVVAFSVAPLAPEMARVGPSIRRWTNS